jgi:acyl carrier protein
VSREDPIVAAIRALAIGIAGPHRMPGDAGADTDLGGDRLDSVELLELVVACETEFGIVFEAGRDLTSDAVATLGSLAALIRSKQGAGGCQP